MIFMYLSYHILSLVSTGSNTIATVISVLVAAVLVMASYFDFVRRDKFVNDVLCVFEEFEKKIEDEKEDKTEVIL